MVKIILIPEPYDPPVAQPTTVSLRRPSLVILPDAGKGYTASPPHPTSPTTTAREVENGEDSPLHQFTSPSTAHDHASLDPMLCSSTTLLSRGPIRRCSVSPHLHNLAPYSARRSMLALEGEVGSLRWWAVKGARPAAAIRGASRSSVCLGLNRLTTGHLRIRNNRTDRQPRAKFFCR
jgi:hypothetical protein